MKLFTVCDLSTRPNTQVPRILGQNEVEQNTILHFIVSQSKELLTVQKCFEKHEKISIWEIFAELFEKCLIFEMKLVSHQL